MTALRAARPVDLERLRRALWLDVVRVRRGEYVVNGHAVTGTDVLVCDCADAAIRGARCKHVLCVELRRGNPEVLAALAALVPVKAPREPNRRPTRPRGARSPRGRYRRRTLSTTGVRGGLIA